MEFQVMLLLPVLESEKVIHVLFFHCHQLVSHPG